MNVGLHQRGGLAAAHGRLFDTISVKLYQSYHNAQILFRLTELLVRFAPPRAASRLLVAIAARFLLFVTELSRSRSRNIYPSSRVFSSITMTQSMPDDTGRE